MTDLEVYRKATKMMGRPKFSDLMDEVREFWEEPSWEITVCGCGPLAYRLKYATWVISSIGRAADF